MADKARKFMVSFSDNSLARLDEIVQASGEGTREDAIQRALMILDYLQQKKEEGFSRVIFEADKKSPAMLPLDNLLKNSIR